MGCQIFVGAAYTGKMYQNIPTYRPKDKPKGLINTKRLLKM
jgi:hypothetical protein